MFATPTTRRPAVSQGLGRATAPVALVLLPSNVGTRSGGATRSLPVMPEGGPRLAPAMPAMRPASAIGALHRDGLAATCDIGLAQGELASMAGEVADPIETTRARVWLEIGSRVV